MGGAIVASPRSSKKRKKVDYPQTDAEYEADRDLECYVRAECIKEDPERYKRMQAWAKKKMDGIKERADMDNMMLKIAQGKDV